MFKMRVLFLVPTLLLCACAGRKNFSEPYIQKSKQALRSKNVYDHSFSNVWQACNQALSIQSIPIMVNRKQNGLIITDWLVTKSDRLFSGYGESKIPYKVRYKLKINIEPKQKGTVVTIEAKEQYYTDAITSGMDFQGSLYKWVETKPSIQRHSDIFKAISQRL